MAVTITSAHSASAPYLGTWESAMSGYCSSDAVSGPLGATSGATLNGVEIVAVGAVNVDAIDYIILVMPVDTPQNVFDGLAITAPDGSITVYETSCALYANNQTELLTLTVGGNTAAVWLWQDTTAQQKFITAKQTIVDVFEGFNCDCSIVSTFDTLVNVRKRMLIRLGYPNQVANPPPGMASLIDEYLRSAQRIIYRQVQRAGLQTERFFRWTMKPGLRYYGILDNDGCCDLKLDPLKITWVGFEDLNKAWYRMDEGIPPEYYTRANINFGFPTHFEIRSCIEIFPAPQAAYTLWIKGDIGLAPLVVDGDQFTIDDEAVFLLALGNAKSDRGAKDAQLVLAQAGNYIKGLVAGAHGTKRYVPRAGSANILTPPKFLPLGDGEA